MSALLRPSVHHRFEPFQQLPGSHVLDYIGDTNEFPIGYIGGGPINAAQARATIEEAFQHKNGPIIHVALTPHDGTNGIGHNHIVVFDELPASHTTVVADAVIVRKTGQFMVETLLGDCSCDLVANDDWAAFIHCGTSELFAGLLDAFAHQWPIGDTNVFMGPCITGRNYAYSPDSVPEKFKGFLIECDGHDTLFDEGWTFGLAEAIESEFRKWAVPLTNCNIDPFAANLAGHNEWASARYAKYKKDRYGDGDGLSPRDMALFRFSPA